MPAPSTTWVPTMVHGQYLKSQSKAAEFYLLHTKLSQRAISRRVPCSTPLVCQRAKALREAGQKRPK